MFTKTILRKNLSQRCMSEYSNSRFINVRVQSILDSWFEDIDRNAPPTEAIMNKWFTPNQTFDDHLAKEHLKDLTDFKLTRGMFWISDNQSVLASIILGDQISRHTHRKRARAYETDDLCLKLAKTISKVPLYLFL